MQILIEKDYQDLSERAAEIIADFVKQNTKGVLGLATGSTPVGAYKLLVKKCEKGEISFKNITTFNLDDYLGLPKESQHSYRYFMNKTLFLKTDINIKNTFFPNEVKDYDKKIEDCGGIDLQILGIGSNGHIGFNEPGSNFSSKTREVLLSESTIKDNSRFFERIEDVPKKAATMGIATIMKARKIVLLASGENKKEAIFNALKGPVTTEVPASVLQQHPNLMVILDKESAAKLK